MCDCRGGGGHEAVRRIHRATPCQRAGAHRTPHTAHRTPHTAHRIADRAEEIAETITAENGKPLKWARVEVQQAASMFQFAAQETRCFVGGLRRLDIDSKKDGRLALVRRRSRGPVLAITPFSFPLKLVAHKVASALAVGAPVIVKPASATPLSALLLGEILAETELAAGAFSILTLPDNAMTELLADQRLPVISLTGPAEVGWSLLESLPRKHVVLRLGGNSQVIICPDWSTEVDLDLAAARIAVLGNHQAGQSGLAVRRVIVHQEIAERFVPRLVSAVRALRTGSPHDPEVEVGPLIDEAAAKRAAEWIDEAVRAGATILTGGARSGASLPPTILTDVPGDTALSSVKVLGPIIIVFVVDSMGAAWELANANDHSQQVSVFTHDVRTAFLASAELEANAIIIGDAPTSRTDRLSHNGIESSGTGRADVSSTMFDFTKEQVIALPDMPS